MYLQALTCSFHRPIATRVFTSKSQRRFSSPASLNRRAHHQGGSRQSWFALRDCVSNKSLVHVVLPLTVVVKRGLAELTANTRLLVATEWHLVVKRVVSIHPYSSSAERIRDLDGGVEVRGVHSGGKTVSGLVAERDDLLLGLELADAADRAEDLLLHDLHVLLDVGEDGGLDEVALVALALAADLDLGAFFFALLDVAIGLLAAARKL